MQKQMLELNKDFLIDFSSRLGSGSFGDVYKGMWKSQNKLVAIKKIKDQIANAFKMMEDEVQIMKHFQHQNVLNFIDLIRHKEGLFLVVEFCEGGTLTKQISKQQIPERNCFQYFKSLIFGMAEINKLKHIHRDLKPDNILFTKNKILKISDFGFARRIIGDDIEKMQEYSAKGSPLYASPQVLNAVEFSGKCDVWSAGLILIEMLTQMCPLQVPKVIDPYSLMKYQKQVTSKTGHYVFEGNYNKWFKEVAAMMLVYDEKKRASFAQIKQKIQNDEEAVMRSLKGFAGLGNIALVPLAQIEIASLMNNVVQAVLSYDEIRNQNRQQQLFHKFQFYLQYLYNRGKIFVDVLTQFIKISSRFNETIQHKTQFNKAVIYLLLFLAIGYYIKTLEYLVNILNVNEYQLPDGSIISKTILSKSNKLYSSFFSSEKQKFQKTILQLKQKLSSQKFVTAYPQTIQKHSVLVKQLEGLSRKEGKFGWEDYEKFYSQFVRYQCLELEKERLGNQEFGRLYWLILMLAKVEKVIPMKEFMNDYVINGIVDEALKTEYGKVVKKIEELKGQMAKK